ncbi:ATP-binding protein [Candidatus Amarobacter glycogenicus]|uniref:AAA family ATPase n=1 Tax=Candidatus Amarobacter glycogenicus TaxID=3140699 RepID=UPI0031374A51|nr:ATP-binding protein [Dehalococcoidia bacterium]
MFLNRTRELGYLNDRYGAGRSEIVVLYGRRRVGKSALLFEWSEGKPCIYFFARRADRPPSWASSREVIYTFRTSGAAGWIHLSIMGRRRAVRSPAGAEHRLIVVLDEFPYLVEADRNFPRSFSVSGTCTCNIHSFSWYSAAPFRA